MAFFCFIDGGYFLPWPPEGVVPGHLGDDEMALEGDFFSVAEIGLVDEQVSHVEGYNHHEEDAPEEPILPEDEVEGREGRDPKGREAEGQGIKEDGAPDPENIDLLHGLSLA